MKEAKLEMEDLAIKYENTIVKDINGETIAVLSGTENREIISITEMPDYLPKAFIAIEDERFYDHSGVDIKRTGAATVTYLLHGGSSSFGGSLLYISSNKSPIPIALAVDIACGSPIPKL